jgi:5-methyltetrahydrofolate--homocysteine methyltransferase
MSTSGNGTENLLKQLAEAVIEGDKEKCEELTNNLLGAGLQAKAVLDRGLVPGMDVVGKRFRENEIFLPEVLVSARAMKASLAILEPLMAAANEKPVGTCVIGTVKGDIHDIGKNIVGIMLRGAGYKVIDIGVDNPVEKFLSAIEHEKPQIVAMSALLTTTMGYMKVVVDRIRAEGIPVKIMVGGAPLSQEFAEKIGADAYARSASEAVDTARGLLGSTRETEHGS